MMTSVTCLPSISELSRDDGLDTDAELSVASNLHVITCCYIYLELP